MQETKSSSATQLDKSEPFTDLERSYAKHRIEQYSSIGFFISGIFTLAHAIQGNIVPFLIGLIIVIFFCFRFSRANIIVDGMSPNKIEKFRRSKSDGFRKYLKNLDSLEEKKRLQERLISLSDKDGNRIVLEYLQGHPEMEKRQNVILAFQEHLLIANAETGHIISRYEWKNVKSADILSANTGATGADALMGGMLASGKAGKLGEAAAAAGMINSMLAQSERFLVITMSTDDNFLYKIIFKTNEKVGAALVSRITRAKIQSGAASVALPTLPNV